MSKIARFAVLVVSLVSLFAVMSSTAGAVTWHNSGDTAFTATGGAGTLSSTNTFLICSGSNATGTVAASPFVGPTWSAVNGTIQFTGCSLSGQAVGVDCGYTLTATVEISATTTTGDADATCGVYLANTKICHIEGKVHGFYHDPVAPSTAGRLTTTTGGTLTTTNGVTNCPLGPRDEAHLSPLLFTISTATGGPTPHLGPIITRTA